MFQRAKFSSPRRSGAERRRGGGNKKANIFYYHPHPAQFHWAPLRKSPTQNSVLRGTRWRGTLHTGIRAQIPRSPPTPQCSRKSSPRGSAGSNFCECKNLRRRHQINCHPALLSRHPGEGRDLRGVAECKLPFPPGRGPVWNTGGCRKNPATGEKF